MEASECWHDGDLAGALDAVSARVRQEPGNADLRASLFQVLAASGDWDRARSQLELAASLDAELMPFSRLYLDVLAGEAERAAVFAGSRTPEIWGASEPWIGDLVAANRLQGAGNYDAAETLRSKAFAVVPTRSGTINGARFDWIADADERLGPVLEAFVNGQYRWLPLERIGAVTIEPPRQLGDQIWLPAVIAWAEGGKQAVLVPTRYAGSEQNEDALIRLGRKTAWRAATEELFEGEGQRVLATDTEEYAIMDVREIVFDRPFRDSAHG
jgi:type VI secretion system protein ImpE